MKKHICKVECLKNPKHIWEEYKAYIIIGVIVIGSIIERIM